MDDLDLSFLIGKLAANWFWGEGGEYVADGFEYLQNGIDEEDPSCFSDALQKFNKVKSNDKKYIVAASLYGKAICNGVMHKFSKAYSELDALQSIEVTFFTMNKDTIAELKREGCILKNNLKEYEEKLKREEEEWERKQSLSRRTNLTKIWLIVLSILFVLAIGIIVFLIYFKS